MGNTFAYPGNEVSINPNNTSVSERKPQNESKPENRNNAKEKSEMNEDDAVFFKILSISNKLLEEYNQSFLEQDFCDNLAIIYEKNLSRLNIKLLQHI